MPFFSIRPRSQDKNLYKLRTKITFKMKQKTFFIILANRFGS